MTQLQQVFMYVINLDERLLLLKHSALKEQSLSDLSLAQWR